jgi:adenosine deaminase
LFRLIYAGERCRSLDDYLKAFDITLSVLQTEDALFRAAVELAEDCARENVRYLEVRYSPMLHTQRGLKLAPIVEAVIQGLRAGERDFGVRSGVILCGIRSIDLAMSLHGRAVRGVQEPRRRRPRSRRRRYNTRQGSRGVGSSSTTTSTHAGEAYGQIDRTGDHIAAHRIGTARGAERDRRITVTITVSRWRFAFFEYETRAAPDLASHPLPFFYTYGLRVTINTDNRLMTDTTVSKELLLCHQQYGFSLDDLKELIISGFKSAFLPYREKADLLKKVTAELGQIREPTDSAKRSRPAVTAAAKPLSCPPPIDLSSRNNLL